MASPRVNTCDIQLLTEHKYVIMTFTTNNNPDLATRCGTFHIVCMHVWLVLFFVTRVPWEDSIICYMATRITCIPSLL